MVALPARLDRKSHREDVNKRCLPVRIYNPTRADRLAVGRRRPSPHLFVRLHADPAILHAFRTHIGSWGECWLWDGRLNDRGYGVFCALGQKVAAHRASYMLHKGPICGGLHVLHKCDVRNCVNPAHLTLGTHLENMRDMVAKGRHVALRGERVPGAKLREEDVLQIRKLSGPARIVAHQFGVSKSLIEAIRRRKVWRHLP